MTLLPICYDEWVSKVLDCASSKQELPQSCLNLWKYEPVFGCAEHGPESVDAQTTGIGVGKGGAGGESFPSKALSGSRENQTRITVYCTVSRRGYILGRTCWYISDVASTTAHSRTAHVSELHSAVQS